jgi:D-3-phosphoglycerate dehydrogenase
VVVQQEAPGRAGHSGRPRVVVWDPISWSQDWSYEVERQALDAKGVDLVVPKDEAESDAAIVDADVVIACQQRGVLGSAEMATMQNAAGIICYSIGMNQVDHAAARDAGIPVTNVPFCVDEVSDHAITFLLMAERRIFPLATRTAKGVWDYPTSAEYNQIHRIKGRTLGIVGIGRIGKEVARKAHVFGYKILAYDPNVSDPGNSNVQMVPLDTLMAQSDSIVTCADLNPTSRHVIGRDSLRHVRPGTLFVNIARGGLVDEDALFEAIADGRIAYAALDVREDEPPNPQNDGITGLANVVLTPHTAGASVEAREMLHHMTADVCVRLLTGAGRLVTA